MSQRSRSSQTDAVTRQSSGNGHQPASFPSRVVIGERNLAICAFCRNALRDVCVEKCSREHRYDNLDPRPLEDIPFLPSLPSHAVSKTWTADEKWAITYLVMYYLLAERKERR